MSQTFRTPPRQIGFKPAAPAAPRLTQVQGSAPAGVEAKIRQQLLQLQQLQAKLRIQEERLPQLKVPLARQQLEAQIQQMRKEFAALHQSLLQLRGSLRLEKLKTWMQPEAEPIAGFAHQIKELDALYRAQQPLPQKLMPLWEICWQGFQQIQNKLAQNLTLEAEMLEEQQGHLTGLGRQLWQPEAEQLAKWWENWCNILPSQSSGIVFPSPAITTSPAPPEEEFAVLSFDNQGPLELSFDLSNRKSVVRNQMGITLNQPKKNYQEYLEEGFTAIDQTVASQFENRQPLYGAVEAFLEAVSLDRSRYEAYFGLGYLYSLVKDANHALYFLDLAWRISGDQAIQDMMERVRSACSVSPSS